MNVDIAERLAKRRREAGYSQESLAEKLGVSRQAVSKWERSESSPDTDNLIALAQLYGVSLDDLLYVEESFKDDVEFEAADRAEARKAGEAADAPRPSADQPASPYAKATASSAGDSETTDSAAPSEGSKAKGNYVGPDGIHINDGGDYVHISWRDGIHVKESKKGDEVHVGWDGVHVKEGSSKGSSFSASDDEGNTVDWTDAGVVINGKSYDSWEEAHEKLHPDHAMGKAWKRFPFPLVAILAYLMFGFIANEWGYGLFVFFTIPVYYMLGHAIHTKKIAEFLEGVYPIGCVAWFLFVGFAFSMWHPAWIIFLTIPLVEWFIHSISRASRRRKKAEAAAASAAGGQNLS